MFTIEKARFPKSIINGYVIGKDGKKWARRIVLRPIEIFDVKIHAKNEVLVWSFEPEASMTEKAEKNPEYPDVLFVNGGYAEDPGIIILGDASEAVIVSRKFGLAPNEPYDLRRARYEAEG